METETQNIGTKESKEDRKWVCVPKGTGAQTHFCSFFDKGRRKEHAKWNPRELEKNTQNIPEIEW